MAWEYTTVEMTDFGHPGGGPRFLELAGELGKKSAEGWEVVQIVPTMMRGRADTTAGSNKESSTNTAVALLVMLRREAK